jgi:uncharacterized protein (TIGR03083 family)
VELSRPPGHCSPPGTLPAVLSTESAGGVDHLAELGAATARFAAALASTPLDGRPATFRKWDVTDLAAHLGEVHRWAAEIVETGHRATRSNRPELTVDPATWYDGGRSRLLDVLEATDPERGCWTHHPDDRIVRYWHRRQLHETLVHLWDLRSVLAPGDLLADVAPAVCADGIDEVLTVFPRRASPADRGTLSGAVGLHASDAGRSWTVSPGWELTQGAGADTAASIAGPAGALLLHVWRRPIEGSAVELAGDPTLLDEFRRANVIP